MPGARNDNSLTMTVPIPEGINALPGDEKVVAAKQATMLTLLGNPRVDLTDKCQAVANPKLKVLMVTEAVGPFRATGLRPAVQSLRGIMTEIREKEPQVHALLGSAGMLCVRHVRGIPTAISNHAWGTAIDLTIDGELDPFADGTVQHGLTLIAPIFNRHGWFWGAGFRREDGMHFECSDGLIRQWAAEGRFGEAAAGGGGGGAIKPPEAHLLSLGDRGDEVGIVQETLNAEGAGLLVDRQFGRDTQAAVMRFQSAHGLTVDGVVGRDAWAALRKVRRTGGLRVIGEPEPVAPSPAKGAKQRV
jgi:hypothetical protein